MNELMVVYGNGNWSYFKTSAETAKEAYEEYTAAAEKSGINMDNMKPSKIVLRNSECEDLECLESKITHHVYEKDSASPHHELVYPIAGGTLRVDIETDTERAYVSFLPNGEENGQDIVCVKADNPESLRVEVFDSEHKDLDFDNPIFIDKDSIKEALC